MGDRKNMFQTVGFGVKWRIKREILLSIIILTGFHCMLKIYILHYSINLTSS